MFLDHILCSTLIQIGVFFLDQFSFFWSKISQPCLRDLLLLQFYVVIGDFTITFCLVFHCSYIVNEAGVSVLSCDFWYCTLLDSFGAAYFSYNLAPSLVQICQIASVCVGLLLRLSYFGIWILFTLWLPRYTNIIWSCCLAYNSCCLSATGEIVDSFESYDISHTGLWFLGFWFITLVCFEPHLDPWYGSIWLIGLLTSVF